MELRTRILPKMLNSEVEEYLQHDDIIIVPVGTVEMHGGFPLDSETVVSEAIALKMAEACGGLVLTGLPYFYSGATASGRGTVQVSVRQGIDYLGGIARSLLRQGFKRQVYLSFHGPAHMTICPMVRDFFDETGVPILYMDLMIQMQRQMAMHPDMDKRLAQTEFVQRFHDMTMGSYRILGRLEDVPLTTAFAHTDPQTCAPFNDLFGLAYQSAAVGYCFADPKDHMSTTAIPDAATRQEMAERGVKAIDALVAGMDMPHVVAQLRDLEAYNRQTMAERPWMPAAWNTRGQP